MFKEIQSDLIMDAKERGYTRISEIADDAVETLYFLMLRGQSEFVKMKSAETLMNYLCFNIPRETHKSDSKEMLNNFMREIEERQRRKLYSRKAVSMGKMRVPINHPAC